MCMYIYIYMYTYYSSAWTPNSRLMQYLLCNLCSAIFAMQSLLCNLCSAIFAMQSLLCNLCFLHPKCSNTFYNLSCLQYVVEHVEQLFIFLGFLNSDCKKQYKTRVFCNMLLKMLKHNLSSFVFLAQIAKHIIKHVFFAICC